MNRKAASIFEQRTPFLSILTSIFSPLSPDTSKKDREVKGNVHRDIGPYISNVLSSFLASHTLRKWGEMLWSLHFYVICFVKYSLPFDSYLVT